MAKTPKTFQISTTLVALTLLICTTNLSQQPIYVKGWAVGPTHYEFSVENAMDVGIMNVHCKSEDDDLGLVRLPVHNNYTHGFRTQFFKTISFFCELMIPGRSYKIIDTFKDVIEFVDHQCGGRHCFWQATENGIYLFHLQRNKYFKKFDWGKYPPDEEELKKLQ